MIELRNLTKVFTTNGRRKPVFRNLNLTVPAGTSVGLLGRNGAGKSTLLQILAGTLDPTSGEVITNASVSWPVGFSGSFHPDLTGAQNTRFLARVYGVDSTEMSRFVEDFAELGSHFHMPIRTYSSGMRGRLAFGASMAIKFDYYLVDEATATGDQSFRAKADATFQDRMRDAGSFVVSHSMNQIRSLCDVGLVLENGQISYFDDVNDAISYHEANLISSGAAMSKPKAEVRMAPMGLSAATVQNHSIMKDDRNRALPNGQYVRMTGSLDALRKAQEGGADRPGALLLCLHGGGGVGGNPEMMDLVCSKIFEAGEGNIVCAAASYRLMNRNNADLEDMIEDTGVALEWALHLLRTKAPEGTRLYLLGASFGGLLVLEALRRAPADQRNAVAGLILLNPVVDTSPTGFVNLVIPKGDYAHLDPMQLYADPALRTQLSCLIMHGKNDDVVPVEAARAFAGLWDESHSQMIELPGSTHGFFNRMPHAQTTGQRIATFLRREAPGLMLRQTGQTG